MIQKKDIATIYLTVLILVCSVVFMIINPSFSIAQDFSDELINYNRQRIGIQKTGMLVLSGWALTNLAVGAFGIFSTKGRLKYFHQMNAAWNIVNLSIGTFAYYQAFQTDPSSLTFMQSMGEAQSIENFLTLNIGLDVGYIAAGAYLWERGIRKDSNRLLGYGPSLILQGSFLLLFDAVLYGAHRSNNRQLQKLLDDVAINGTSLSLTIPL